MASKLITVERAEKEINRLQKYIELVENYEADTLEKWIVKEYAYTICYIHFRWKDNG